MLATLVVEALVYVLPEKAKQFPEIERKQNRDNKYTIVISKIYKQRWVWNPKQTNFSLPEECKYPWQCTDESCSQQTEQRRRRKQTQVPRTQQQPPPTHKVNKVSNFHLKNQKPSKETSVKVRRKYLKSMVRKLPSMFPHFPLTMLQKKNRCRLKKLKSN